MDKKIGFIGGGNMGGAMIGGIVGASLVASENILVADLNKEGRDNLYKKFCVQTTNDNIKVAKEVDILFLSIKPNIYPIVIDQIKEVISSDTLIVSIAAGQTIEHIEALFGTEIKLVRTMPNTPALVGEGMAALCPNKKVTKEELEDVKTIFESFGKCEVVSETLMDTVIGVSGSSPAYVYMFIEAMADAAVLGGMPRLQAYQFAAQSVLGSAKMVLETGMHPGILKDMVCSPGGTTIAAVAELEKSGFRGTVMSGTLACIEKAKEMNQKN
ncbi:MAG: pyrroline-5-carboxylate reductase [Velocimicrobium sp.]